MSEPGSQRIGTNSGHGYAWPRPDGVKAKCGGPGLCQQCAADAAMVARWRSRPPSQSADHGPIDPAMHELMNGLAATLDEVFNGEGCSPEDRKVGFFLTTFNFGDAPGRFNYISNADPLDVRTMLKDILARVEGRMQRSGRA